jgi:hypothetical protein
MLRKKSFSSGGLVLLLILAAGAAGSGPPAPGEFTVTLPPAKRPFPEPLPAGAVPSFKIRGTKGWAWTPEQYLAEIPYLVQFKMNFMMNCYLSMFDVESRATGNFRAVNRWWQDLPTSKRQAFELIVRECQKAGIQFCFSMNPNLMSQRVVNDGSPENVDLLWKHYAWMQGLGVKWFNVSLDDVTQGVDAASQARVVNVIFQRLRAKDPAAQMIFCPTYYAGDGTGKDEKPYLEILAQELNKDIYLFWTGDAVVGKVSRPAAEAFRRISGHRLFLWDNYPVNDNLPTMHLGPVVGRDSDLCEVVDGYMSNPHCQQNEVNRIPLATCADYAYNSAAYNPDRSIGQAILHLAQTRRQQETMKELVEAYPGMLVYGANRTSFNAVQDRYIRIIQTPHSRVAALAYIESLQLLSFRLAAEFPDHYLAAQRTLLDDIHNLEARTSAKRDD